VRDGTDEIFTIRLPMRRVNAEVRSSFVSHHISATFELRGSGVKAAAGSSAARALTPPEQLDPDRSDGLFLAEMIVEKYVEKYSAFRKGSATRSSVTTRVHSARRSQREPAGIPARPSGREQPSGPASGQDRPRNRGVAHAPDPARHGEAQGG
jgi:hypothetical protein